MSIREKIEEQEYGFLSKFAVKSAESRGRKTPEEKCGLRTDFQRDRDRIYHSKSFRRLMHKTQVFISPEGDHYRTRLTHTLETSQISRTISRALALNEDLTEAIALGHDLGHTAFGHPGEDALNSIMEHGFRHNEQSLRVTERLEKNGKGLNLTFEVLDGMVNHRSFGMPSTLEGKVVQIADKIAYINHDIDDSIRAGILMRDDLPEECLRVLGETSSDRINFLINNIVNTSCDLNNIMLEKEIHKLLQDLRSFMFENIYRNQLQQTDRIKINGMFSMLFDYFIDDPDELPDDFKKMIAEGEEKNRVICDFIAGMTDRYARKLYMKIFVPSSRI